MLITVILFWLSLIVLFYCYVGYGCILYLYNLISGVFRRTTIKTEQPGWPPVTMIIPAYNEASILDKKIQNTQEIEYPAGNFEIIIVTDGSTDGSEQIGQKYSSIKLLHQPQREGKIAAIKRAMMEVQTPLVVFSDANALLNKECLQRIVRHYADPKTGGVAGEKKVINPNHQSAIGEAEGIYWHYESFMKKQDAEFNTVVGAAGELYSIRTRLFPQIEKM
jgi:cellulose synthase/poly-beta-1,6-N-acetylglucosamine synthase-like glycosyltransferase